MMKIGVILNLFIFIASVITMSPQLLNLNLLGLIESGTIFISNTQAMESIMSSDLKWKKNIQFSQTFQNTPQILLTITSIQRISGDSNSFAVSILSCSQDYFEIQFDNFFAGSAFTINLSYLAYENTKYVQVHQFIASSTHLLTSQNDTSSSQHIKSEKIAMIPITKGPGKLFQSTAFLLGAKTSFSNQTDLAISISATMNYQDSSIEVIATSWNKVNIDKIWGIVVIWTSQNSYQGEWKNFLDLDSKSIKNHPWIDQQSSNRFLTLELSLPLSQNTSSYIPSYGIRGFEIRQGSLAVIVKNPIFNYQNQKGVIDIGTSGDAKLIGVQISIVALSEIKESRAKKQDNDDDTDPILVTSLIGSSLIIAFALFSILYLKYFQSPNLFKHQKFDSSTKLSSIENLPVESERIVIKISPAHSQKTSIEQLQLLQLLKRQPLVELNNGVVTLEYPERLNLKEQLGKPILLSKDLLTGIRFTEKIDHQEIKDVIQEQSNEGSVLISQQKQFSVNEDKLKKISSHNQNEICNIFEKSEENEQEIKQLEEQNTLRIPTIIIFHQESQQTLQTKSQLFTTSNNEMATQE